MTNEQERYQHARTLFDNTTRYPTIFSYPDGTDEYRRQATFSTKIKIPFLLRLSLVLQHLRFSISDFVYLFEFDEFLLDLQNIFGLARQQSEWYRGKNFFEKCVSVLNLFVNPDHRSFTVRYATEFEKEIQADTLYYSLNYKVFNTDTEPYISLQVDPELLLLVDHYDYSPAYLEDLITFLFSKDPIKDFS